MSNKSLLLLVAAAVVGYVLWTKYATLSNLNFIPLGITPGGGGFGLSIGVQNTSNATLQFNSLSASLIVNGQNVGNVSGFSPVPILPNSQSTIPLQVIPNILGLASQVASQISSGEVGINSAVLQGTANVSGNQYPVNVQLV